MVGLLTSVGKMTSNTTTQHQYSITMQRNQYKSDSDHYGWFMSFTSNTPIRTPADFASYMQGKNNVGFAGGGFYYTYDYYVTLLPGYLYGNKIHFYCVRRPNYSVSGYSYGFYGTGEFVVDSNVTITCQQIS